METQKVKDLSTAQSPKATDFVMLITSLTNNVLEKCQLSALRDILATNSISDNEGNALTTGSDNKLYVPDLTENISIIETNLDNFDNEVNRQFSVLETALETQEANINLLENRLFHSSVINIGLGTTNLSNYLPSDGKEYMVCLQSLLHVESQGRKDVTVSSDIFAANVILSSSGSLDDSGWASTLTWVPIGSARNITLSCTTGYRDVTTRLVGYKRI